MSVPRVNIEKLTQDEKMEKRRKEKKNTDACACARIKKEKRKESYLI